MPFWMDSARATGHSSVSLGHPGPDHRLAAGSAPHSMQAEESLTAYQRSKCIRFTLPDQPSYIRFATQPVGRMPPFTFALNPGNSLPTGLALNSATGTISGTPTATATNPPVWSTQWEGQPPTRWPGGLPRREHPMWFPGIHLIVIGTYASPKRRHCGLRVNSRWPQSSQSAGVKRKLSNYPQFAQPHAIQSPGRV
jgi:hypothetical protein